MEEPMRNLGLINLVLIFGFALPVWAGQPPGKGPTKKLDTPTQVACTKAGEQLTVTWGIVDGAALYRVHLESGDVEVQDQVAAPPYTMSVQEVREDEAAPVMAKVRAMANPKGGKGASQPSSGVTCQ
jgi:hypothetical protein